MRRRIKSVGEPIVSLTDAYPLAVVFVIAMRTKDGESRRTPIGTGFLVTVPSEVSDDTDVVFLYAVTASHVIASGEPTWLRFNTMSGGVEDLPVHEWFSADPVSDVAVTPVTPTQSMRWAFVPADGFLDSHSETELEPHLGDSVYFIGLLANMRAMAEENVPMVRSGTLGRLYQEEVELRRPDGSIFRVTGHLIDCRSFGGFSGSPCFIQFVHRQVGIPAIMTGKVDEESTLLLGLISGHWDDPQEARQLEEAAFQVGTWQYQVNTGVAVVTPSVSILEALNREELREMRHKSDEKRKTKDAKDTTDRAVTLDAANTETMFRKQEFEEALHRVTRPVKKPEK